MSTADEREAFERLLDEVTARAVPLGRTAGEVLFAALTAGGPEAADHLLKAARELLLAAKAVLDAGERALEARREEAAAGDERDREDGAGGSRVRRIDLA
jgi:hypothetical protein